MDDGAAHLGVRSIDLTDDPLDPFGEGVRERRAQQIRENSLPLLNFAYLAAFRTTKDTKSHQLSLNFTDLSYQETQNDTNPCLMSQILLHGMVFRSV